MPGQCFSNPSLSSAKRSGSLDGVSSSLRTWQCAIDAPASKAACVLSTCSATVIGTAGLLALVGSEPVMATQMMQGLDMTPLRSGWGASLAVVGRSASPLTAARAGLDWRAGHRAVRAEYAAIAGKGAQQHAAARAGMKPQAGVGRHRLVGGMEAMRTGQ